MKKQSGFTLIELAIVLVIIGLLLGGVLKGQELITNAKVKSMANELKAMQIMVYGYQDKFHAIPGDDIAADTHMVNGVVAATPAAPAARGNAQLEGVWDSQVTTDETFLFWQHVRLSGLAQGSPIFNTAPTLAAFIPRNSDGGRLGIASMSSFKSATGNGIIDDAAPLPPFEGSFAACSTGITGKLAKQIDVTIDDGNTQTGQVRVGAAVPAATVAIATGAIAESTLYTVCYGF